MRHEGKMDLFPSERTIPRYDVSWGVFCCVSALPRGAYTSTAHGAVCVLRVGSCAVFVGASLGAFLLAR